MNPDTVRYSRHIGLPEHMGNLCWNVDGSPLNHTLCFVLTFKAFDT